MVQREYGIFWILLVTIFNGFPRFVSGAYLIQACGRDLDSALFGICRGRFNTAHDEGVIHHSSPEHVGVVTECCENPCSESTLMSYCADDVFYPMEPNPRPEITQPPLNPEPTPRPIESVFSETRRPGSYIYLYYNRALPLR